MLTSQDIAVSMPEKINPGPLAARITFFAPVCLLFFFLVVGTVGIVRKIPIHPMHYFFVAGGFFAFHLLFAYLVDHLPVHASFAIAAATTVLLVTGYLAAALGRDFPWKIAAVGQFFYLILFSYSFFLKGMTGLTVTVGAVLTLAALMRVTAKVDWFAFFGRPRTAGVNERT
jgi:inner membrane protein involved in colicin E2 resistance